MPFSTWPFYLLVLSPPAGTSLFMTPLSPSALRQDEQLAIPPPNVFVSNGTCYWAADQQMNANFLPCGNDFYGHRACCWVGDTCLADNACFGSHGDGSDGTRVTYLAGCSDPSYADATCPDKAPYEGEHFSSSSPSFTPPGRGGLPLPH